MRSAKHGYRKAIGAARQVSQRLAGTFVRFRDDRQGMGAVEFALLVPMLLVVYLTAFELTIGFSVSKRATSASSTVADLVAQQETVNKTYLGTMDDVAASIFVPYGTTGIELKITGISVDAAKNPTVAWSWANDGSTPYAAGSAVSVSDDMLEADTFLVHSELSIPHELLMYLPNFSGSEIKNITIGREYYYRQRVGDNGIDCTDC